MSSPLSRRSFIAGLLSAVAAPAIGRAGVNEATVYFTTTGTLPAGLGRGAYVFQETFSVFGSAYALLDKSGLADVGISPWDPVWRREPEHRREGEDGRANQRQHDQARSGVSDRRGDCEYSG